MLEPGKHAVLLALMCLKECPIAIFWPLACQQRPWLMVSRLPLLSGSPAYVEQHQLV